MWKCGKEIFFYDTVLRQTIDFHNRRKRYPQREKGRISAQFRHSPHTTEKFSSEQNPVRKCRSDMWKSMWKLWKIRVEKVCAVLLDFLFDRGAKGPEILLHPVFSEIIDYFIRTGKSINNSDSPPWVSAGSILMADIAEVRLIFTRSALHARRESSR